MTQLKPVDQKTSTWQRTTLLATDNSHSIIGEVLDGKHNSIAYTAYGEQSAPQENKARLGFNGQLREAKIGWYLLGNGYRAYNTRLMRFHSPDSWSPFGGGGLNAYMYCVGDPVNRSDPTGHVNRLRIFGFNQHKSWNAWNLPNVPETALDIERGMRPQSSGGLASLIGAGAAMAARAPGPGGLSSTPIGNSPAIAAAGSAGIRNYPAFESAAITATASRLSPPPVATRRFSTGGGHHTADAPPSYNEVTSLSNADTFAQSQQGRTFVVNRAAVPNSGYLELLPPPMVHPTPPRPPTPPRSPSPPTSRDSTPPRSRNNSGGNNTANFDDLALGLRFIRR